MKHSKFLFLAGGILALSTLVGCGGGNSGGSGKITITFDHTFGEGIEKGVQAKFKTFAALVKENEGVDVELVMNPAMSYNAVVNTVGMELEAGNGPTMAVAYPDHIAAFQNKEKTPEQYIVNMDAYMDDPEIGFGKESWLGDLPMYNKSDIIQSFLREGQQFSREGTYCLPFMKSTEILQYNLPKVKEALKLYNKTKDLSETERLAFLQSMSFEELMEIAKVILDNKTALNLPDLTYPVFYDSDSNMAITQLIQNGLVYSEFDESKNVILGLDATVPAMSENITKAKQVLQNFRTWHNQGLLSTKSVLGTYSSSSFKRQECIFVIGSSGGAGYSVPEEGDFDAGYARVPYVGENSSTPEYVSQGPSITFCRDKSVSKAVNDQRIKYAWKFYKYLILPKTNIAIACNNSQGYVPVRRSAYATAEWGKVINPDPDEVEEISYYTYTAKIIGEVINNHYYNTIVFNGSDKYRTNITSLVKDLQTTDKSIDELLATCISETKKWM